MKVQFDKLPKNSKTPVLTYCRKLEKKGLKGELLVYRGETLALVCDIEKAAKLGIGEEPYPHFRKYAPPVNLKRA